MIGAQIAVDIRGELFNRILAVIMLIVVAIIVLKPKAKALDYPNVYQDVIYCMRLLVFSLLVFTADLSTLALALSLSFSLNNVNRLSLIKTNATKVAWFLSIRLVLWVCSP